jgi:hypothetical protein
MTLDQEKENFIWKPAETNYIFDSYSKYWYNVLIKVTSSR